MCRRATDRLRRETIVANPRQLLVHGSLGTSHSARPFVCLAVEIRRVSSINQRRLLRPGGHADDSSPETSSVCGPPRRPRQFGAERRVIPPGDVGRACVCAGNLNDTTLPWKSDYDAGTLDAPLR